MTAPFMVQGPSAADDITLSQFALDIDLVRPFRETAEDRPVTYHDGRSPPPLFRGRLNRGGKATRRAQRKKRVAVVVRRGDAGGNLP
jgi:hypothetical protein